MKTNWIQNQDGSIYHLKLKKSQLAPIIITVGDPERVSIIAKYLDRIETEVVAREFHTITGYLGGQLMSIISTGIGTDNIDIVLNEIDALFNIDLQTGLPHKHPQQLKIIRLGTSGAIQREIEIDQILITDYCIALDNTLSFYPDSNQKFKQIPSSSHTIPGLQGLHITRADPVLLEHFNSETVCIGNTVTAAGFYAPQGRPTRISQANLLSEIETWNIPNIGKISNIEMETSMIYGLSTLMGHQALSINAILANRITGKFSNNPEKTIKIMIGFALEKILSLFGQ
ncbi:MAG: nucleoside phosphorylase [Saprospiraceae bacterium]